MKFTHFIFLFGIFGLSACIGDDIVFDTVEPSIRITNPIDTIAFDSSYQFEYAFFNNVGAEESIDNALWSSSDPSIISINSLCKK